MNSKQHGRIGVAKAITWFTENGYSVFVPFCEADRYDLIVDLDGVLSRVEVKSTSRKTRSDCYSPNLITSGGNRTQADKTKRLSSKDCDLVFISVADGTAYLFPISVLEGRNSVTIGAKSTLYSEYRVA